MTQEKNSRRSGFPKAQAPGDSKDRAAENHGNGKWKKRSFSWFRTGVIAALAVLFFAVITGGTFSLESVTQWIQAVVFGEQSGSGYPLAIPGTKLEAGNFAAAGGRLAVVTDTTFAVYNRSGSTLTSIHHGYNAPVLKAEDGVYLMYDLGGKHFRLMNKNGILHEESLNTQIFTGAVNRSGVTAVATSSKNYCAEVSVYNTQYKKSFSWSSPLYRITALALDGSGSHLAAAGVAASNGQLVSAVYIFNLTQETPLAVYEFADNVILSLSYLEGGSIAAVGDAGTFVLSSNLQEKRDYSYSSSILHSYSVSPSDGVALLLSDYEDGRDCRLVGLDRSGAEVFRQPLPGNAVSVFYHAKGLVALSGDSLSTFDSKGTLLKNQTIGKDIRAAVAAGDEAYLLGVSEIRQLSLR